MNQDCRVSRSLLEALCVGPMATAEEQRLRGHLAECGHCQARVAEIESLLAFVRETEGPVLETVVREREIAAALRTATAASREPAARSLRWPVVAGALIAVGLAVAVVLVHMPVASRLPRVVEGSVSTGSRLLTSGTELAAEDHLVTAGDSGAVIRLPDGSQVEATPGSRLAMQDAGGAVWLLDSGLLQFHVRPRRDVPPLRIETREVTTTVVGTRFAVERQNGADTWTTTVTVTQGVVDVRPASASSSERLSAGHAFSWPSPMPRAVPATSSEVPTVQPPAAVAPPATAKSGSRHPVATELIRDSIRAGKIALARKLIAQTETLATGSYDVLAELGVLSAEADLAERKTHAAIERYLAVERDFPRAKQTEDALFAAAQVALDDPSTGYRPALLLRDYLATYPHGHFADDARRVLARLDGAQP